MWLSCSVPEPGARGGSPVPLALGLSSHMTAERVNALLGKDKEWTVKTLHSPAEGKCPRMDLSIATVDAMSDHGEIGKARLSFVNDRLYSVWFTPKNLKSYVDALRRDGLLFDAAGQHAASDDVRIWLWSEQQEGAYVGWEDRRIRAEMKEWRAVCP